MRDPLRCGVVRFDAFDDALKALTGVPQDGSAESEGYRIAFTASSPSSGRVAVPVDSPGLGPGDPVSPS